MKVDISTNYNNKQSFGAIRYDSAKETLRSVLNIKELEEFKLMVGKYKNYDLVDAIFFGDGKKLSAKVIDTVYTQDYHYERFHSPYLFEGKMHFIKRVVKNMVDRTPKAQEIADKQKFEF